MTRVVMLGPPGAGKGTQARGLARRLGVPSISTGELFRAAAADDSELGRAAYSAMTAGRLVPDEVTNGLVARRLDADDAAAGFVLDGFPRTVAQARELDRMLMDRAQRLQGVVLLQAGEEEIVRRLSGRRTCRVCGAVWHLEFRPTELAGTCDGCGGELYQRQDDTAATIRERIRVYRTHTAPLAKFYADAGLLFEIDAIGAVDDVRVAIANALEIVPEPVEIA